MRASASCANVNELDSQQPPGARARSLDASGEGSYRSLKHASNAPATTTTTTTMSSQDAALALIMPMLKNTKCVRECALHA